MKIAIDIRKIGKEATGSETYFYCLVQELAKLEKSQKHKFLLLTDQNVAKISNILGKLPPNFQILKVAPTAKLFWTFYSLPRFLKKQPADVFHTEYIAPFYLSRKTKIITTIHDVSFRANPEWIGKKDRLIMNNFIPLTLKRADAVITVSNFSKSEILKYYKYPKDKIFVTYPAIDKKIFNLKGNFSARKALHKIVGGSFPFILHISSLQPRKNVPLIISAFAKLKKDWKAVNSQHKSMKLVIVGNRNGYNYDKKIETETLKQVREGNISENDIIITGYLPINLLPSVYRGALVFIFPSEYEGFGIPLIESMASKTPVIASNIGSLREVGGDAVVWVDLLKKDRLVRMAEAMRNLIENKKTREEKIKLGLERVKLFSWAELAKKTLDIYETT